MRLSDRNFALLSDLSSQFGLSWPRLRNRLGRWGPLARRTTMEFTDVRRLQLASFVFLQARIRGLVRVGEATCRVANSGRRPCRLLSRVCRFGRACGFSDISWLSDISRLGDISSLRGLRSRRGINWLGD